MDSPSKKAMALKQPSQERLVNSLKIGNEAEFEWAPRFFHDLNWSFEKSSSSQNRLEHFDFIVRKNNRHLKVEVKAPKICHNSQYKKLSLVLSEYTGITGKPGWIRGKADVILQFLSSDAALAYPRIPILNAFSKPNQIERFSSYNAPLSQWFGRTGFSRAGMPNQDIIRWDELSFYLNLSCSRLYSFNNGRWQVK